MAVATTSKLSALLTITACRATKANTPIAIGLSGVAYPQGGGATPLFSNPTTPTTIPNGATNASLQPVASASGAASNTNFSFLNAFAMFPSWSGTVNFPGTAYVPYTYASGGASMPSVRKNPRSRHGHFQ